MVTKCGSIAQRILQSKFCDKCGDTVGKNAKFTAFATLQFSFSFGSKVNLFPVMFIFHTPAIFIGGILHQPCRYVPSCPYGHLCHIDKFQSTSTVCAFLPLSDRLKAWLISIDDWLDVQRSVRFSSAHLLVRVRLDSVWGFVLDLAYLLRFSNKEDLSQINVTDTKHN